MDNDCKPHHSILDTGRFDGSGIGALLISWVLLRPCRADVPYANDFP